MYKIDLSNIYDDCYSGYDDCDITLNLDYDAHTCAWQNKDVKFYNSEYGWAYEDSSCRWNYGYTSLEDAITIYAELVISESYSDKYTASRVFYKQYDCNFSPKTSQGSIHCVITTRFFKGVCDRKKMTCINDTISSVLLKLAS